MTPWLLVASALATPALANDPPVTTAHGVEWVASPKLPSIRSRAENSEFVYKDATIPFPINVWGGWAPIVAANGGFEPNDFGVFAQRYGFKLDIQVIEDPSEALTAFASGKTPILWGTVDMMALYSSELLLGPRPKVFLQVDWSNGGDGIVVRSARVKSANDLRGKTVVLCPFSPSHYYLLTVLRAAGIDPKDVKLRYTKTAYQAAKAFADDPSIDAAVSFSPDIYKLAESAPREIRVLTSTGDAKRLLADVFAVREDFARAHPEVVSGLVAGILEGTDFALKNPDTVAAQLFEGFKRFGIASVADCKAMMGDAHFTNYAENLAFFADPRNPTSFARTFDDAVAAYRSIGAIDKTIPAAQIADAGPLGDPKLRERWKESKDEYSAGVAMTPEARAKLAERRTNGSVLTMVVYFDASKESCDASSDEVARALEEVAKLAGRFSGAAVLIEGYTDPVGSGLLALEQRSAENRQVPREIAAVSRRLEQLSRARADFVAKELHGRYGLAAEQFAVLGRGGAHPITQTEADRWRNRRVEVTVVTLEAE
jgi:outer membrane protein OmpA-like peptidoglycan-associated protein/ABC-type taurine transport system substrate-binding protein